MLVKKFILKSIIHKCRGTLKSGVAQRILYVAPKVGEKGVALNVVGEKRASYIIRLHVPSYNGQA